MLLSELVYECIKNSILFDESSFTYDAFLDGSWEESDNYSSDYSFQINNVYNSLNRAIQRLSDLDKLPLKVIKVDTDNISNNIYTLPIETEDANGNLIKVKKGKSFVLVFKSIYSDTPYIRFPFKAMGKGKIRIEGTLPSTTFGDYYFEYKEEIPRFSSDDFAYYDASGDALSETTDVDLEEDYGINGAMCSYIIEYVKSEMYESIDIQRANLYLTRAEQYFSALDNVYTAFKQERTTKTSMIGW